MKECEIFFICTRRIYKILRYRRNFEKKFLLVFSPCVTAFHTAEELCRWFICSSGLLQPPVYLSIPALRAFLFCLWKRCRVFFQNNNAVGFCRRLCNFYRFYCFVLGITALPAYQCRMRFLLNRYHYGTAFWTKVHHHTSHTL